MPNTDTARLAALLAEHAEVEGFTDGTDGGVWRNYACSCGWWSTADQQSDFRAHVAATLAAAGLGFVGEAERERDEALRAYAEREQRWHWNLIREANAIRFRKQAEARAEAAEATLREVRLVERNMAEQALQAWQSADARRGLADHAALEIYADALTRWSERLRLAFSHAESGLRGMGEEAGQ